MSVHCVGVVYGGGGYAFLKNSLDSFESNESLLNTCVVGITGFNNCFALTNKTNRITPTYLSKCK